MDARTRKMKQLFESIAGLEDRVESLEAELAERGPAGGSVEAGVAGPEAERQREVLEAALAAAREELAESRDELDHAADMTRGCERRTGHPMEGSWRRETEE